jgi:DNA-binding transcriptional LysR family regulator
MDFVAMDTRFLNTLVEVVECGSVAEAARKLHLTAAGVSQRIRSLEDEIGVRLVARSGRTVRPTAAAASILGRARIVQREVRDLKSIAASGMLSGELRLGVIPSLLSGLVPNILCRFAGTHPQIELRVSRNSSVELYRKLLDGDIDAAVTSHPPFALPKTCDWALLREEPFVVVTPGRMPSRHPHTILQSEPFIRLDRQVYAGQLIDQYLRKAGIRPRERLELDGFEAIAIMVDRGLGVAILPDWPPPWPEGLRLRKLALPVRSLIRRTGLLWRRGSLRSGLIHAFRDEARLSLEPRAERQKSRGRRSA